QTPQGGGARAPGLSERPVRGEPWHGRRGGARGPVRAVGRHRGVDHAVRERGRARAARYGGGRAMTQIAAADVVVVGCGIIGLATAERLVASNLSVVLVDELGGVANGPSGASGGLVRAFDPAAGGSWAAEG